MPSKTPRVQTPAQSPATVPQDKAINLAIDAVNLADSGTAFLHEMRAIFRAIHRLSGADETIHDLAYLGVSLADDRHNLFDCEAEAAREKLAVLRGGNHA